MTDAVMTPDGFRWLIGKRLFKPDLWKCEKCGAEIISEKYTKCTTKGCNGVVTRITDPTPMSSGNNSIPYWCFPEYIQIDNINIKDVYLKINEVMKRLYKFADDLDYKLYTLWIISTYKIDYWDTVPFFIFFGDTNTGKTMSAVFGADMGHKIIPPGSISGAAVVRAADLFGAGVSIDEAHHELKKDHGNIQLFKFCKESHRRGSVYIVAHKDNQRQLISYSSFGFKQFMTEDQLPRQIRNRSITISTYKAVPELPNRSFLKDGQFDDLKNKLFNWSKNTNEPPILDRDFKLTGRERDVYGPLIRIAMMIGIDYDDIISHAIESRKVESEKVKSGLDNEVAEIIFYLYENKKLDIIPFFMIRKRVYPFDDDNEPTSDECRVQGTQIGRILRKMGFTTKKSHGKTYLNINESGNMKVLKTIIKRYEL